MVFGRIDPNTGRISPMGNLSGPLAGGGGAGIVAQQPGTPPSLRRLPEIPPLSQVPGLTAPAPLPAAPAQQGPQPGILGQPQQQLGGRTVNDILAGLLLSRPGGPITREELLRRSGGR